VKPGCAVAVAVFVLLYAIGWVMQRNEAARKAEDLASVQILDWRAEQWENLSEMRMAQSVVVDWKNVGTRPITRLDIEFDCDNRHVGRVPIEMIVFWNEDSPVEPGETMYTPTARGLKLPYATRAKDVRIIRVETQ
jgi:hypothetical protein